MTDEDLLELNAQGFIPGPRESEDDFKYRVSATKKLFEKEGDVPDAHWHWVRLHLKDLFQFQPYSLVAHYSNSGLAPWQGAACWIYGGQIPVLQLRNGFRKGSYLGLYTREEILAHEAVHAARAAFDEPENEEFFAYASSGPKWRRVLGPIVKRNGEPWFLFGSLGLGIGWEPAWMISLALVFMGFFRLIRQHLRLNKASKMLMGTCKDVNKARAILFRLTDEEIRSLSRGKWIYGDDSLRWRLIRLAYL